MLIIIFFLSGERRTRGRGRMTEAEIADELDRELSRSEDEEDLLSAAGSLDRLAAWIGQDLQDGKSR